MKHIQKRLNSKTDETSDELDGNYKTLKENLPGEESIINNSDPDQETDLEYFNPVFKPRPTYNTNLGVTDDYDKLAFQNSTSKLDENSASNKNNEEIEMLGGVSNYGYIDEKKRPESWDQDLSAVNHYSTAIRNPVNIPPRRVPSVGMEMSESPPRDYTNSISKQSDYSSISEGNPYLVPGDKGPQYEDLAAMREQHKQQQQTGIITSSGSKKANMIYESAVITQKSEKYRKRTSIDEATGYDENSNYCHLICTILIGILAIVALLVIFLMVFGVINAKCKDCDESATGPTTAAQAHQKDFSLQLQYLQGNLTQLKNEMTSNSSDVVKQLENELAEQKLLVESLTRSLNSQIAITSLLNNTTSKILKDSKKIQLSLIRINGSVLTNKASINLNSKQIQLGKESRAKLDSKITYVIFTTDKKTFEMKSKVDELDKSKLSNANFTFYKQQTANQLLLLQQTAVKTGSIVTYMNQTLNQLVGEVNVKVDNELQILGNSSIVFSEKIKFLSNKVSNLTLVPGPQGKPGFNGTQGPAGPISAGASFKDCIYGTEIKSLKINSNHESKEFGVYAPNLDDNHVIIGASCNNNDATYTNFTVKYGKFMCNCKGFPKVNAEYSCVMNYWKCPK